MYDAEYATHCVITVRDGNVGKPTPMSAWIDDGVELVEDSGDYYETAGPVYTWSESFWWGGSINGESNAKWHDPHVIVLPVRDQTTQPASLANERVAPNCESIPLGNGIDVPGGSVQLWYSADCNTAWATGPIDVPFYVESEHGTRMWGTVDGTPYGPDADTTPPINASAHIRACAETASGWECTDWY